MWWPSFVSVLQDLWQFCFSSDSDAREQSDESQVITYTYLERPETTAKPVRLVRLQAGVTYGPEHQDTKTIRNKLSAYDSNITYTGPLTQQEYALYRLQDKGLEVPLIALRMTPLGRWHTTLKGQNRVTIGVVPYTDAVMEWSDTSTDNLAWVHGVTPDQTIIVGSLMSQESGMYTVTTYFKEQWRELRPIFTTFA